MGGESIKLTRKNEKKIRWLRRVCTSMCFPLFLIYFISKTIPQSLCTYSSPVSFTISTLQSPKISRKAAAFFKKRDKEEKVCFGTLLQWLCADVRDEKMAVKKRNVEIHKSRSCHNDCCDVLVFYRVRPWLLAGDKSKLSTRPQRQQTPGPSHQHHQRCVCVCYVSVLVCMYRCGWG